VLIEGFIVQGPAGSIKKIMVRAIGPSLAAFGISDALANPILEIYDANNVKIASNNDWKTTQVGGIITSDQSTEIAASGLAPGNDLESTIIANLAPGSYTAIVRGFGNTAGTGVVDAYDLSAASPARLVNISTRGLIQPGDKLMIAGFIIQNAPVRVVVRAIGPSLSAFGITNALPDTTLQVKSENGTTVIENDDWQTNQKAELEQTSLQPSNPLEAAVVVTLPPGQYTAQVRGFILSSNEALSWKPLHNFKMASTPPLTGARTIAPGGNRFLSGRAGIDSLLGCGGRSGLIFLKPHRIWRSRRRLS